MARSGLIGFPRDRATRFEQLPSFRHSRGIPLHRLRLHHARQNLHPAPQYHLICTWMQTSERRLAGVPNSYWRPNAMALCCRQFHVTPLCSCLGRSKGQREVVLVSEGMPQLCVTKRCFSPPWASSAYGDFRWAPGAAPGGVERRVLPETGFVGEEERAGSRAGFFLRAE